MPGSAPCGATPSHNIPSRFLAEVPAELVKDVGVVGGRSGYGGQAGYRDRGSYTDRGSYSDRSGYGRRGSAADDRAGDWRTDDDGPVFGAGRGPTRAGRYDNTLGPRREREKTTTGAENLDLAAGDKVVHDHWGEGVVIATVGKGERAQAKVKFASVGEKRLLLSATPLQRA